MIDQLPIQTSMWNADCSPHNNVLGRLKRWNEWSKGTQKLVFFAIMFLIRFYNIFQIYFVRNRNWVASFFVFRTLSTQVLTKTNKGNWF